jgi:hypothetical protein
MGTAARALASAVALGLALGPPSASRASVSPQIEEAHGASPGAKPAGTAEPLERSNAQTELDQPELDSTELDPVELDSTELDPVELDSTELDPVELDQPELDETRVDASGGTPVGGRSASAALDEPNRAVPERMRSMQAAAWWTLFGAFAVGTTAGVFSGLAVRQQDRALRVATVFEPGTGRQPLYADKKAEYDTILRRGRAFQGSAIALATLAGAAAVTAAVLFIVDERRRRRDTTALRWLPTGIEVRF